MGPKEAQTFATTPLCVGCGYDLRGIAVEGGCPECGTAVQRSITGDALEYADDSWLRTVHRGASLIAVGPLSVITIMTTGLILIITGVFIRSRTGTRPRWIDAVMGTADILLIAAMICVAIGAVLFTTQEPRLRDREPVISTRSVARWGMIAAIVLGVTYAVLERSLPASATTSLAQALIAIPWMILLAVTLSSILFWAADLAARMPNADLARRSTEAAKFVRWALPVIALPELLNAFSGSMQGMAATIANALATVAGCFAAILMIGLIGYTISIAILALQFRHALGTITTNTVANDDHVTGGSLDAS